MSVESLQILISAIDEASQPIQRIANQIEQLDKTGKSLKDRGKQITDLGQSLSARVTAPIVGGLSAAAAAAISYESAFADVNKVMGYTEAEAAVASQELLGLSRTLPVSAQGLAEIAAAGGQLGTAKEDIMEFTELTAQMSTAFDMGAGEAGQAIGELKNVYGLTLDETELLGDAFNHLSNNAGASAGDIVNAAGRIGGTAQSFGLADEQTAALATTLIEFGAAPEVAATAINGILPKLQTATGQGDKFQEALQDIGLSAEGLEKSIAKDAAGGLQEFVGALSELTGSDRAKVLQDMFGTGADSQLLGTLAQNSERLARNLDLVGDSSEYAGSMFDEFEARSATTENSLQLLQNQLGAAAISIGSVLLPAINDGVAALTPLIEGFTEFASANPGIVKIGIAIAGIVAAIGPILIVIGQVVGAIGTIITMVAKAKAAFLAFSGVMGGGGIGAALAGIKTAISGIVYSAAGLAAILLGWVYAIFAFGSALTGTTLEFSTFLAVIKNALMTLPENLAQIPAAIGAIFNMMQAMAVNKIMQIRLLFTQMVLAIQMIFQQIPVVIGSVFSQISSIIASRIALVAASFQLLVARVRLTFVQMRAAAVSGITNIVAAIRSGGAQAVAAVASMGAQIIARINAIAGQALAAGRQIVSSIASGIMAGIGEVKNAIGNVASAIKAALPGSPVKEGVLRALNNPASNPGAEISRMIAAGITAGAPAVNNAMTNLGRNALGPTASPQISPTGGAGLGGGNNNQVTINISGVSNQGEAEAIADTFEDRVRRVLSDFQRNEARVAY